MPRGQNPNSRKALEENRKKGAFCGERAVEASKKSAETRRAMKTLTEDLKERCTPERLAKMNETIISMAEDGNLKAWELIRDTLGEKPKDNAPVKEAEGSITFTIKPASEKEDDDEQ